MKTPIAGILIVSLIFFLSGFRSGNEYQNLYFSRLTDLMSSKHNC